MTQIQALLDPAPIKISVLMPVFNSAKYLKDSVESILFQTFKGFEFIIVDDGSNDCSYEILQQYEIIDGRIKLIKNEINMGIVHSLNKGIDYCRGEYIFRMDADDIALPDRLEKQLKFMDDNPSVSVLSSSVTYIDETGLELGIIRHSEINSISLLSRNPVIHPTAVLRRNFVLQNGLAYKEEYRLAEDYYLWLEMSKIGTIRSTDEIVLKYRINRNASRVKHIKKMILATLKVKLDGFIKLGIRPSFADLIRFFMEFILLILPSSLILKLYFKKTFGKSTVSI